MAKRSDDKPALPLPPPPPPPVGAALKAKRSFVPAAPRSKAPAAAEELESEFPELPVPSFDPPVAPSDDLSRTQDVGTPDRQAQGAPGSRGHAPRRSPPTSSVAPKPRPNKRTLLGTPAPTGAPTAASPSSRRPHLASAPKPTNASAKATTAKTDAPSPATPPASKAASFKAPTGASKARVFNAPKPHRAKPLPSSDGAAEALDTSPGELPAEAQRLEKPQTLKRPRPKPSASDDLTPATSTLAARLKKQAPSEEDAPSPARPADDKGQAGAQPGTPTRDEEKPSAAPSVIANSAEAAAQSPATSDESDAPRLIPLDPAESQAADDSDAPRLIPLDPVESKAADDSDAPRLIPLDPAESQAADDSDVPRLIPLDPAESQAADDSDAPRLIPLDPAESQRADSDAPPKARLHLGDSDERGAASDSADTASSKAETKDTAEDLEFAVATGRISIPDLGALRSAALEAQKDLPKRAPGSAQVFRKPRKAVAEESEERLSSMPPPRESQRPAPVQSEADTGGPAGDASAEAQSVARAVFRRRPINTGNGVATAEPEDDDKTSEVLLPEARFAEGSPEPDALAPPVDVDEMLQSKRPSLGPTRVANDADPRRVRLEKRVIRKRSAEPESPLDDDEVEAQSAVGRRIAKRYHLIRLIGIGGMGAVYEAVDLIEGRQCAVKLLLPRYSSSKPLAARFVREAQAASKVGHPGIIKVFDAGNDGDCQFLVIELLHGQDLSDALQDGGLTLGEIWQIGVSILDALAAAHDAGIVHRDIKPENVYLDETEEGFRVQLLDFGIAKVQSELERETKLTITGTVLGTPHFMSPEQARGGTIDHRADLWSVGAMLFECLVGFPPFDADNYNVLISRLLTELPPKLVDMRPGLPACFIECIDGVLRPEPEERWADAREMLSVLAGGEGLDALNRHESLSPPADWASLRPSNVERPSGMSAPRSTRFDDATQTSAAPMFEDEYGDDGPTVQTMALAETLHGEESPREPVVFAKPGAKPGTTDLLAPDEDSEDEVRDANRVSEAAPLHLVRLAGPSDKVEVEAEVQRELDERKEQAAEAARAALAANPPKGPKGKVRPLGHVRPKGRRLPSLHGDYNETTEIIDRDSQKKSAVVTETLKKAAWWLFLVGVGIGFGILFANQ